MARLWIEFKIRGGESATDLDAVVDQLAGKASCGSGFDFAGGIRDREYEFATEKAAREVARRVVAGLNKKKRSAKARVDP